MPTNDSLMDQREQRLCDSAAAWSFLHDLFRAPGAEQWRWLHEDWVQGVWARLSEWAGEDHPGTLPLPADCAAYEQQYLATFDVGLPAPPCPLIETHWNKREPTARILHEHILFYKCFGLELRSQVGETADHLRHQLEFLAYLCRIEAQERTRPTRSGMAEEIARGRRDFLARHPGSWIPCAAAKLISQQSGSWPAAWLALLEGWCRLQQEIEMENAAHLAETGGS